MMDKKTLEALRGSIEKWTRIVAGTTEDEGHDDCPLCQMFFRRPNPAALVTCEGCPVAAASGRPNCQKTPYVAYAEAREDGESTQPAAARTAQLSKLAEAELEFLKSLLPPDTHA
jgi:hypothetical protein